MKKKTFIEAIEAIKKQVHQDIQFSQKMGECFPEAYAENFLPDNRFLSNALIGILQEEMNDTEVCKFGQSWIEWFCFETNFGEESYRLKAYDKNGKHIPMSTAEELYDFLQNEKKG